MGLFKKHSHLASEQDEQHEPSDLITSFLWAHAYYCLVHLGWISHPLSAWGWRARALLEQSRQKSKYKKKLQLPVLITNYEM